MIIASRNIIIESCILGLDQSAGNGFQRRRKYWIPILNKVEDKLSRERLGSRKE